MIIMFGIGAILLLSAFAVAHWVPAVLGLAVMMFSIILGGIK